MVLGSSGAVTKAYREPHWHLCLCTLSIKLISDDLQCMTSVSGLIPIFLTVTGRAGRQERTNTVGQYSWQEGLHSLQVPCWTAASMAGTSPSKLLIYQIMTKLRAGKHSVHKCMPSPKGVWVCKGKFLSKAQREVRSHLRRVSMRQTQFCHRPGFTGHQAGTWPLNINRETCQDTHCLIPLQLTNASSKPAASYGQEGKHLKASQ